MSPSFRVTLAPHFAPAFLTKSCGYSAVIQYATQFPESTHRFATFPQATLTLRHCDCRPLTFPTAAFHFALTIRA